MALGPAESFSYYSRDTKIRFSFDRSYSLHVGRQEVMKGYIHRIAPSGHLIAYLSARCAYDPKRPEASRPTETAGCVIPSRVGAVACASGEDS
jgi:hypothetical protein